MSNINVKGKPAITMEAKRLINGQDKDRGASFYDCEGDKVWLPHSVHEFDENNEEVRLQEWYYDKLVDEGYFEC